MSRNADQLAREAAEFAELRATSARAELRKVKRATSYAIAFRWASLVLDSAEQAAFEARQAAATDVSSDGAVYQYRATMAAFEAEAAAREAQRIIRAWGAWR